MNCQPSSLGERRVTAARADCNSGNALTESEREVAGREAEEARLRARKEKELPEAKTARERNTIRRRRKAEMERLRFDDRAYPDLDLALDPSYVARPCP